MGPTGAEGHFGHNGRVTSERPDGPLTARGRPPRILMATPRFFPEAGGVEAHVYEVSRRLSRWGADVTVLTTDTSGRLPRRDQVEGVSIRRVSAWPSGRDYRIAPGIYRAIAEGGWDVVHVQSYHTAVAPTAMCAARRHSIPYVLTFHGGGHSTRLRHAARPVQLMALRPLLAGAARLVAVAEFEIDLYRRRLGLPRDRFALIPNGYDLPPVPGPPPDGRSGTLIASVGRLERYKGHQRVIAAMPYVLARRADARLWVAGRGPYESALRKQAERLGIADRVEIRAIPAEDREGMARKLSTTSLVVCMSEWETHPVAMLEALAVRRPLLVADHSGLRELARRGLAQPIALHSPPEQLARAILDRLDVPPPTARPPLASWDDCAGRLRVLYEELTPCAS